MRKKDEIKQETEVEVKEELIEEDEEETDGPINYQKLLEFRNQKGMELEKSPEPPKKKKPISYKVRKEKIPKEKRMNRRRKQHRKKYPPKVDLFSPRQCIYCNLNTIEIHMVNITFDEDRLKKWENELCFKPENAVLGDVSWICRSHFNSADFLGDDILKSDAIPNAIKSVKSETDPMVPSTSKTPPPEAPEAPSLQKVICANLFGKDQFPCAYCGDWISSSMGQAVPKDPVIRELWSLKLGEYFKRNIESTHKLYDPIICKWHLPMLERIHENIESKDEPEVMDKSGRTCIYCLSNNVYADLLNIDLDKELLDRWGVDIGIKIKPGQIMKNLWICKSHFDSRDVTRTGKLTKYAVPVDDPTNYTMGQCVYCKSKKHQLSLVRVPEDPRVIVRYNVAFGVKIPYPEVAMNPWVCKSHFNAEDIERSAVLKPHAIPVDIAPERNVKNCEYCHSTKRCSFLLNVKMNQERVERWNDAVGIFFVNVDNIWMCKTHFNPGDISATGELKTDAIPIDGVPISDVRVCVYCKSRKSVSEFAKVIMEKTSFDTWIKASGFELSYNDIIENNWICKSHFHSHDILPSGTLKAHALPIEATEEETADQPDEEDIPSSSNSKPSAFPHIPYGSQEIAIASNSIRSRERPMWRCYIRPTPRVRTPYCYPSLIKSSSNLCCYCQKKKELSDLVGIQLEGLGLEHWKRLLGDTVCLKTLLMNPRVCMSHFGPDDFTIMGELKMFATPSRNLNGEDAESLPVVKTEEECRLEMAERMQRYEENKIRFSSGLHILHDHNYSKNFQLQFHFT